MRSPAEEPRTDGRLGLRAPATVLCPTDFSPVGDRAVDLAYRIAGDGGIVHLLHVCEPAYVASPLDASPVAPWPVSAERLERLETRTKAQLARLEPEGTEAGTVRTEKHVVHDPNPALVIEREAARLGADLIVMGTNGRTGMGRLLLGSVATEVMRHATVPVALVHARAAEDRSK